LISSARAVIHKSRNAARPRRPEYSQECFDMTGGPPTEVISMSGRTADRAMCPMMTGAGRPRRCTGEARDMHPCIGVARGQDIDRCTGAARDGGSIDRRGRGMYRRSADRGCVSEYGRSVDAFTGAARDM
jgi:hypothetical protein